MDPLQVVQNSSNMVKMMEVVAMRTPNRIIADARAMSGIFLRVIEGCLLFRDSIWSGNRRYAAADAYPG